MPSTSFPFPRPATRFGLLLLTLLGCDDVRHDPSNSSQYFSEITAEVGLPPEPAPFPDGNYLVPEVTHGGVALLDYNNDGDLDIYQVCHPPPSENLFATQANNRLYEQQADGTFVEVASQRGVADPGLGNAPAVADIDNDGDLDIYVTNYGTDALYVNQGDGSFENRTVAAGISGALWSSAAAFVDYDRDNDLDLVVVHYVDYQVSAECRDDDGRPMYCGPNRFQGVRDNLYRNDGQGNFTEVSELAGIKKPGKGLGVVCVDLTDDGWVDIYVANDGEANHLWVNQGDGSFVEEAQVRGVAFNGHGAPESSMGVTAGDIDGDGHFDLFMTHFSEQTNTLYRSMNGRAFTDQSALAGTAAFDLPYTGWGCGFFDCDHDGDLDLAVVNGPIVRRSVFEGANLGPFWNEFAEPNFLFRNTGSGQFENVSPYGGELCSRVESSRGLAFGDLDKDGDLDIVTTNVDNMLRVFRNEGIGTGHWLQVHARIGNRDAIGALIELIPSAGGKPKWMRPLIAAYSYASSSQPMAHFGLGDLDRIDAAIVTWPDGSRERFAIGAVDRVVEFESGTGQLEAGSLSGG